MAAAPDLFGEGWHILRADGSNTFEVEPFVVALEESIRRDEPSATAWVSALVAFSKTWSASGTHTIRIVSVGSPVPRIDIDAFGVIR